MRLFKKQMEAAVRGGGMWGIGSSCEGLHVGIGSSGDGVQRVQLLHGHTFCRLGMSLLSTPCRVCILQSELLSSWDRSQAGSKQQCNRLRETALCQHVSMQAPS